MMALAQQRCISKLATGRCFRSRGFHPAGNELFLQHLDVQEDLVFEFAAGLPLSKQRAKLCHENPEPYGHDYCSPCRLSTRAMTLDIRSQFSVSIASCFRPPRV